MITLKPTKEWPAQKHLLFGSSKAKGTKSSGLVTFGTFCKDILHIWVAQNLTTTMGDKYRIVHFFYNLKKQFLRLSPD